MSDDKNIKHFLIVYDIANGLAHIDDQDDYDSALRAYADAEKLYRDDANVEVVLLGSDSRETIARTHSSYFEMAERHVDRVIARDLAALGLK